MFFSLCGPNNDSKFTTINSNESVYIVVRLAYNLNWFIKPTYIEKERPAKIKGSITNITIIKDLINAIKFLINIQAEVDFL